VSTASNTVRTGLVQQSLPSPEDESHRGMLSAAWIRRVSCVHEDGRSQYVDREIHVVVDNLGTHFTAEVRDWLADNPNITFHRTPVGAPWTNQIEIWFGLITRQAIRRGTFSSVKQLITTIENYIANWNANCKPFTWTAAADTILAKCDGLSQKSEAYGTLVWLLICTKPKPWLTPGSQRVFLDRSSRDG
jgi:DDE superfamily endonuclease